LRRQPIPSGSSDERKQQQNQRRVDRAAAEQADNEKPFDELGAHEKPSE
jgi:hypothetical protein